MKFSDSQARQSPRKFSKQGGKGTGAKLTTYTHSHKNIYILINIHTHALTHRKMCTNTGTCIHTERNVHTHTHYAINKFMFLIN